jgi:hypothetical protein
MAYPNMREHLGLEISNISKPSDVSINISIESNHNPATETIMSISQRLAFHALVRTTSIVVSNASMFMPSSFHMHYVKKLRMLSFQKSPYKAVQLVNLITLSNTVFVIISLGISSDIVVTVAVNGLRLTSDLNECMLRHK